LRYGLYIIALGKECRTRAGEGEGRGRGGGGYSWAWEQWQYSKFSGPRATFQIFFITRHVTCPLPNIKKKLTYFELASLEGST